MYKFTPILLLASTLYSSQFSINPSFQGYTGVINTPNAQVIKEAHAVLTFNNQFDNHLKSYDYTIDSSEENYILGFGLFSFMEVQGRLVEAGYPQYPRDLSVNTKLQLPYHHKYLPDIAIGIQDLGGAANHYDNKYIVIDKELWFVRASLGYGISSHEYANKSARMDGVFGAVEIKATDWLYMMAEDDSVERHLGLRVEMPQEWIKSFNLRATIAQNLTSEETSFGLTLNVPLWHESKIESIIYQNKAQTSEKEQTIVLQEESLAQEKIQKPIKADTKFSIQKRLVDFGFENVSVGIEEDTLYVQAENSIFDHTDLDAIGYIAGIISFGEAEYTNYSITLLKNNLQTITMKGTTEAFKEYVKTPSKSNELKLRNSLSFSREFDDETVSFSESKNSSFFIPRVELSLGLITAVGTEVGAFDYAASLGTNIYMNIYDGLVVSALYEIPFASSDDYKEGGAFYNRYKTKLEGSRLVNAMMHQTLHYKNLLNTLSLGKYETDYLGVINQSDYTTTSGENSFSYKGGYFVREDDTSKDKYFSLGSYRYFYAPLDSFAEVTYGKYWYGDVGTQVEFKRFFGETSVAFNYKHTTLDGIKEEFAGINISFPLTTRKLYKSNYVQIKGEKDFTYELRTTVNKDDGTNTINHIYGRIPKHDFEIRSSYLDRDRLSESYVKQHLDRLRDAYLEYGDSLE